jgi:hypothetical protein
MPARPLARHLMVNPSDTQPGVFRQIRPIADSDQITARNHRRHLQSFNCFWYTVRSAIAGLHAPERAL